MESDLGCLASSFGTRALQDTLAVFRQMQKTWAFWALIKGSVSSSVARAGKPSVPEIINKQKHAD